MKLLIIFMVTVFEINAADNKLEGERTGDKKIKVCYTRGCNETASWILNHMDDTVEPCDNFYDFACGKFLKEAVIPDDKTSINTFTIVEDSLQKQLKKTIAEKDNATYPRPFQLVKKLYGSCMNKSRINERGLEPLHQMLKKLGGWPVLNGDQWIESDFHWIKSVYKFREIGLSTSYFMDLSVFTDSKNNTRRIIYIDQVTGVLAREYLTKGRGENSVEAYYKYMVGVAKLLDADNTTAYTELEKSLDFEIKLSKITLPKEERRDATAQYNLMTIKDLNEQFPSIPWLEYINNILKLAPIVTEDEPVVVMVPSFISKLENLLKETPKRVQANYAIWRSIENMISFLNNKIRKMQLAYKNAISGQTKKEVNWRECMDIVAKAFPLSVSSLYVRKYFKKDAKENALQMVHNITQEFKKTLEMANWMDEETRKAALEKLEYMGTHVAYPDELLNDTKLENHYKNVEIKSEYYFESILNISLFDKNYAFSKLREPVNKSDWITHSKSADVNAYYSPTENSIQIPAGILQGAFFSHDRPNYMNYGSIGYVIGHEITHGFDDRGSQYDKNGELMNWWQPGTKEKYLNLTQCIVDQYSNYTVPEIGMNLNGVANQGENIADNGGVKVAYQAYNKWAGQHNPEARLPGLEKYNPKQMFWMSTANVWCMKFRTESYVQYVETKYHSPGEFRVIGPMSNMPEFSRDFNCKLGSTMNPEHKCSVW